MKKLWRAFEKCKSELRTSERLTSVGGWFQLSLLSKLQLRIIAALLIQKEKRSYFQDNWNLFFLVLSDRVIVFVFCGCCVLSVGVGVCVGVWAWLQHEALLLWALRRNLHTAGWMRNTYQRNLTLTSNVFPWSWWKCICVSLWFPVWHANQWVKSTRDNSAIMRGHVPSSVSCSGFVWPFS